MTTLLTYVIELIRFIPLCIVMGYAAYLDYKHGEVPNKLWLYTIIGVITLSTNSTGLETADWLCPQTSTVLGYNALEVIVYAQTDGVWTSRAIYLSPVLVTSRIVSTTWTFKLNVNFTQTDTDTYSTFRFDSLNYKSGIYNVVFTKPMESELQMWRISRGDVIGFEVGAYTDVIGAAYYVCLILMLAAVFYFRTTNFGIIVFLFALFGGSNGLMILLLPGWAVAGTVAFVILGLAFLIWRVIR